MTLYDVLSMPVAIDFVYIDSGLLVLNGTSLNSINALQVLPLN